MLVVRGVIGSGIFRKSGVMMSEVGSPGLLLAVWLLAGVITLFGVFVLRRKMPDAPRPYRVPGYPIVPTVFVVFATVFLALTIYNDLSTYQKALAAGQPAVINSTFGILLIAVRTPVYLLYRKRG